MKKEEYLFKAIIGFALYLIATGISFAFFSFVEIPGSDKSNNQSAAQPTPEVSLGRLRVDPSIPRTEECAINGQFFTKDEREIWEKRRPLAVMIENHSDSRPQSGLSFADVVYEAVAEGGITRFMGIYYCDAAAGNVNLAPVRSARTYFLPWVLEYDALYNHVGGAGRCNDPTVDERAKALCQIEQWKVKDMDQFGLPLKTSDKKNKVCFRNEGRLDHEVAVEHTMQCETEGLYQIAKERDWTNVDVKGVPWDKNFVPWKFKDDAKEGDRAASFSASFAAWKGYENDYGVKWVYDPKSNSYLRSNGGVSHIDLETKEQLFAKNVVIQFAKETRSVDEHAHLLYGNIVSGDGYIFQDGKSAKITWKKADRNARTRFFDLKGKEIQFNRGKIWIEMLPIGTVITF